MLKLALCLLVSAQFCGLAAAQSATRQDAKTAMDLMYERRKKAFDRKTELAMRGLLSDSDEVEFKALDQDWGSGHDRWLRAAESRDWTRAIKISVELDQNSARQQSFLDRVQQAEAARRSAFAWTRTKCVKLVSEIQSDEQNQNPALLASGNSSDASVARQVVDARRIARDAAEAADKDPAKARLLAWKAVDAWQAWRKRCGLPRFAWGRPKTRRAKSASNGSSPEPPRFRLAWRKAQYFLSEVGSLQRELELLPKKHDLTSVLSRRAASGRLILHLWFAAKMEVPPSAETYWARLVHATRRFNAAVREAPGSATSKRLWANAQQASRALSRFDSQLNPVRMMVRLRTSTPVKWRTSKEVEESVPVASTPVPEKDSTGLGSKSSAGRHAPKKARVASKPTNEKARTNESKTRADGRESREEVDTDSRTAGATEEPEPIGELVQRAKKQREFRDPKGLLQTLRALSTKRPKDPAVQFLIGEVYGSVGMPFSYGKARDAFNQVLALPEDFAADLGPLLPVRTGRDLRTLATQHLKRMKSRRPIFSVSTEARLNRHERKVQQSIRGHERSISEQREEIRACERYISDLSRKHKYYRSHVEAKRRQIRGCRKQIDKAEAGIESLREDLSLIQRSMALLQERRR